MRRLQQGLFTLICAACIFTNTAKAGEEVPENRNFPPQFTLTGSITLFLSDTSEQPDSVVESGHPHFFTSLSDSPKPMTGEQRIHYYLKSTFGMNALIRTAAVAGIQQARNTIPEWGQDLEGYGIRFASSAGKRIIKNSIHHGIAVLLHEDPRYYPSGRTGIWNRGVYAASQTLVAHTIEEYIAATATSIGFDAAKNIFREFWPDIKGWLRH
jgi:hypothetical protein